MSVFEDAVWLYEMYGKGFQWSLSQLWLEESLILQEGICFIVSGHSHPLGAACGKHST